ncbi:MAG TPA: DNA mismatch repair protein MutS, partial [Chthoniobacterales bacterium]|nr:DNA mismatch repair protein MutS [Chthoniobacterales bacterium]
MSGTPMMQQYQSIRRSLPKGTLLLFRLGDFYELFFDDAKLAADILGVALTKRNGMPMCGVPFHAAEAYIGKLIKAGHRVAICDQVSEPQPGKIVERKISQIISPGTVSDLNLLESKQNNFLAAINHAKNRFGLALIDVSTGEFRVAEMDSRGALQDELARFLPTELIRPDTMDGFAEGTVYDGYAFEIEQATELLREQFQVQSLDGFGCSSLVAGVGAAGAIIHYLKNQLRRSTEHIRKIGVYLADEFVALDATTHTHLELVGRRDDRRDTSLLRALDRTVTPMGARLLRESILKPLRNLEKIRRRQRLVARFLEEPFLLNACRESMRGVRDVERTLSRVSQGTGGPRDLAAIRHSLEALPPLVDHLTALEKAALFAADLSSEAVSPSAPIPASAAQQDLSSEASLRHAPLASQMAKKETSLCFEILSNIHLLPELLERLRAAIEDEPPATVKEGGIFRSGYDADLDELRQMSGSGKEWIAELQQKEIDRTGIKSLKVRYNSVFGYFIEITKANLSAVPDDYIRKQTTVNGERFITPELKEFEAKVLGADERSRQLEYQLFLKLREFMLGYLGPLQETARAVAQLDLVASLAETARLFGYCQPEINAESILHIVEGRHPVLDQNLTEEKFVPNDCLLDGEANRLLLITGPNMAGKSTYIRQVALLVLMA